MQFATYVDPIAQRYASQAMSELFSPLERARTWRRLWIALAESEHELGLPISSEQLDELRSAADQIDLARVAEHEARLRHDVMAHIHAFGEVAPGARGILHLGATSCFVTDNADLLIIREGMEIISQRLLRMIHGLSRFAREHATTPTLGLTHLQPAQLTTVGKRAALWIQDLVDVWEGLTQLSGRLPFRGVKGTTGTQASFLQLFDGDASKVQELERRLAEKMGFTQVVALTGQTYSRSWDYRVLSVLSELAIALHKFSTDLRLAQSWGELEEPYGSSQIGSSAMPYKRNPMKAERLGSLAKLLQGIAPGMANVAATQWMERTLDDSAFRRVGLAQGFLCADSMLIIGRNIADGLRLQPVVAERRVMDNLPFLAAEELLMHGVSAGGDRQDLHERIRQLSWKATEEIRAGRPNPLRALLEEDSVLAPFLEQLPPWDPQRFIGLAPQQTLAYLDDVVAKLPQPVDDDVSELSV
ncbi:MAG: adenylosuccinate lyase [Planctomycetota bacterium]